MYILKSTQIQTEMSIKTLVSCLYRVKIHTNTIIFTLLPILFTNTNAISTNSCKKMATVAMNF